MTVIEKIKNTIYSAKDFDGTLWRYVSMEVEHLKALVEYYEAAEGMSASWGASKGTVADRAVRLRKARAALEKEVP